MQSSMARKHLCDQSQIAETLWLLFCINISSGYGLFDESGHVHFMNQFMDHGLFDITNSFSTN